ncbi:hypothetical protein FUA23_11780 [Neolewinella aurantiaca]|uniref:Uncharacterized protein n=1 Tax=Neolewinella aurantiaca TaxID=2602767 RepID=A0A5C7FWD1_9BACT|nr:hypothetical protein [Neolewinella aurantiaca]TXF89184.1 hypothetical protein FUA23_11780 [Neolewinella aurantiaca]
MKTLITIVIFCLCFALPALADAKANCAGEFSIGFGECQDLYGETVLQSMGITPGNPNCSGSCADERVSCEGSVDRTYERCIAEL